MSMPTSGCIALKYCIDACDCSSIGYAVDGNLTGNKSLKTLSESEGCALPHSMREFLGYPTSPPSNLTVGWVSDTPINQINTSTNKFEYMELTCANLQTGNSFAPIYCYCAELSADACYCFLGRRTGDGFWIVEKSGTTSGSGTFSSHNVLDSFSLCIGLVVCDNADPPISCVWICLPDPPATYVSGSGTINRGTNYCWDTYFTNAITWCQPTDGVDAIIQNTEYCTGSIGWTEYNGVLVNSDIGYTEPTGFRVTVNTNSLGTGGGICAKDCNGTTFCTETCTETDSVFTVTMTGVTRSVAYCFDGGFV